MRSLRSILALAVTVGVLLGATGAGATTAAPERAAATKIKPKHLPSLAEVVDLYPAFKKGSRETNPGREWFIMKKDCKTYAEGPQADRGRFADYYGPFGSIPVFWGAEHPSVLVLSFDTVASAKKAFAAYAKWIRHCDGKSVRSFGDRISYEKTSLPGLGQQRIAYRRTLHDPPESDLDEDLYLNEVFVWVRTGRLLVLTQAREDGKDQLPGKKRLLKLTRLTLKKLP